ncbi:recombination-associated protein RdgC, partial [Litorivivens sp.]
KNQELTSKEILNHIDSGMLVKKLALSWSGGLEFMVDDQLVVKRLRFSDLIMERAEDVHTDSAAEQFDVDFSIMNAELASFIPALLEAFGGEDTSHLEAA